MYTVRMLQVNEHESVTFLHVGARYRVSIDPPPPMN